MKKIKAIQTFIIVGILFLVKTISSHATAYTPSFNLTPSSPTDSWSQTLEPGDDATLTVTVSSSGSVNGTTYNLDGNPGYNISGSLWTGSMNGTSGTFNTVNPHGNVNVSSVSISCTWKPELPPMIGTGGGSAIPLPPISGSGLATVDMDQPVYIDWDIPYHAFRWADDSDAYTYTIRALTEPNGLPVDINFSSVIPANTTPSSPGWTITGGSGNNINQTSGTVKSGTGSKGKLMVIYTFGFGLPYNDTSDDELVFLEEIKSQTVATVPSNRERATIGVAEDVDISVLPSSLGSYTWQITSGGTLSENSGATTQLTAGNIAATATVTLKLGSRTLTNISYNIITPTGVYFEKSNLYEGDWVGLYPVVKLFTRIYLLPETVNFSNVRIKEGFDEADREGFFDNIIYDSGSDHQAWSYTAPVSNPTAGKGSILLNPNDTSLAFNDEASNLLLYSNYGNGGTFLWQIPYHYVIGTFTSAPFTTVDQKTTLYLDEQSNKWKLKIEKGGRVSEISEP